MKIYLIRHGETSLNKAGVYYGMTDCSLSEAGIKQIKGLGQRLISAESAVDLQSLERVYTSPLKRCRQSAGILFDEGLLTIEPLVREMDFGQWEGLGYQQVQKEHEEIFKAWCHNDYEVAVPDGESLEIVHNRVCQFIKNLKRAREEGVKAVAVVSHQGPLRLLLSQLLGLEHRGFWHFTFEQGCYTLLELDPWNHCTVRYINR